MNVKSVEKLEKSTVALTIEASAEELEAAVQKVYQKQRRRITIPGFRKGHAPRKIIEAMYGAGVFYEEAVNEAFPELLEQAVKQEKLNTVSRPQVEIVEPPTKDGFSFKATVAVQPEVILGQYRGLTAPKVIVEVSEEEIDNELRPYINRATQMVEVDREAQLGDTVTIDYEGFLDGKPFSGGKAEGHDLELGSHMFIDGFEDQLIGVKAGERRQLTVTYPEKYHATELSGKEAVFQVKVQSVKEKQRPVLDDEFAKDVSEFETLAELRAELGKKLAERKEIQEQDAFEERLLDQVIQNMQAEIPDVMVETRARQIVEEYNRRVTNQGIDFEQYLAIAGIRLDQLMQQAMDSSLRQIRIEVALRAIAKAEGFSATDEEVEEECRNLCEQYHMSERQIIESIPKEQLRMDVLHQKAGELIFNSAHAEMVSPKSKEKQEPAAETAETAAEVAEEKAQSAEAAPPAEQTPAETEPSAASEPSAEASAGEGAEPPAADSSAKE